MHLSCHYRYLQCNYKVNSYYVITQFQHCGSYKKKSTLFSQYLLRTPISAPSSSLTNFKQLQITFSKGNKSKNICWHDSYLRITIQWQQSDLRHILAQCPHVVGRFFFLISCSIIPNLESNSKQKITQIGVFVQQQQ